LQLLGHGNHPHEAVFPAVECPFSRQNGVSTASNPGFAGKMPIRLRRIGIPAAKWPSDAVGLAFCRENGVSTGGESPFFQQNAGSTRGGRTFRRMIAGSARWKQGLVGGESLRPVRSRVSSGEAAFDGG
jgi:hypothetical protein